MMGLHVTVHWKEKRKRKEETKSASPKECANSSHAKTFAKKYSCTIADPDNRKPSNQRLARIYGRWSPAALPLGEDGAHL
mmetsp:Transcript_152613/g.266478  ORF Transcript_152613/g.266478 Transcript_152613/m.266478 type:complete len:80 (+) Transcript_152613:51-290(+)